MKGLTVWERAQIALLILEYGSFGRASHAILDGVPAKRSELPIERAHGPRLLSVSH